MRFKVISTQQFLEERRYFLALANSGRAESIVAVDPEEEIICDLCNATVTENPLYVTDWGLYCPECRKI